MDSREDSLSPCSPGQDQELLDLLMSGEGGGGGGAQSGHLPASLPGLNDLNEVHDQAPPVPNPSHQPGAIADVDSGVHGGASYDIVSGGDTASSVHPYASATGAYPAPNPLPPAGNFAFQPMPLPTSSHSIRGAALRAGTHGNSASSSSSHSDALATSTLLQPSRSPNEHAWTVSPPPSWDPRVAPNNNNSTNSSGTGSNNNSHSNAFAQTFRAPLPESYGGGGGSDSISSSGIGGAFGQSVFVDSSSSAMHRHSSPHLAASSMATARGAVPPPPPLPTSFSTSSTSTPGYQQQHQQPYYFQPQPPCPQPYSQPPPPYQAQHYPPIQQQLHEQQQQHHHQPQQHQQYQQHQQAQQQHQQLPPPHRHSNSAPDIGGGGTVEERRARRLARNRESARQSRQRKKQYLEVLEEKVAALVGEVEGVRRAHLLGAEPALQELRHEHLRSLESMAHRLGQHRARQLDRHLFLDQKQQQQQQQPQGNPQLQPPLLPQHQQQQPMEGAVEGSRQWHEAMTEEAYHATQSATLESELRGGLDALAERFGPNCEERRAVIKYQFDEIWALLLPLPLRFLLWMMVQPDSFYSPPPPSPSPSPSPALAQPPHPHPHPAAAAAATPPHPTPSPSSSSPFSSSFASPFHSLKPRCVTSSQSYHSMIDSSSAGGNVHFSGTAGGRNNNNHSGNSGSASDGKLNASSSSFSPSSPHEPSSRTHSHPSPTKHSHSSSSSSSSSSFWHHLSCELRLTSEQEDRVRNVATRLRSNQSAVAERRVCALLAEHLRPLQGALEGVAETVEARWKAIASILSPPQMMAYLGWVARHGDRLQRARLEESTVEAMSAKPTSAPTAPTATTLSPAATPSAAPTSVAPATVPAITQPPPPSSSFQAEAAPGATASSSTTAPGGVGSDHASMPKSEDAKRTSAIPLRPAFAASPGARETVTALLQRPSEDLTLDDVEFLLKSLRQTPAPSAQSSKHSSHHHHHHDHSSSQGGGGYHSSSQDGGRSSSGQLPSGSFGDEDDLDDGYSD